MDVRMLLPNVVSRVACPRGARSVRGRRERERRLVGTRRRRYRRAAGSGARRARGPAGAASSGGPNRDRARPWVARIIPVMGRGSGCVGQSGTSASWGRQDQCTARSSTIRRPRRIPASTPMAPPGAWSDERTEPGAAVYPPGHGRRGRSWRGCRTTRRAVLVNPARRARGMGRAARGGPDRRCTPVLGMVRGRHRDRRTLGAASSPHGRRWTTRRQRSSGSS